jgi:hypothetical protein
MALSDTYAPRTGKMFDENSNIHNIVEDFVGAIKVIDNDHAYIHSGRGFSLNIGDLSLGTGETVYLSFKTPASSYIHFKNVKAIDCICTIWESPDAVDTSSAVLKTDYNLSRASTIISGCTIYYDVTPTLTTAKSIKFYQGEYYTSTIEIDLLQDHTYVIEIKNILNAQNNVYFECFYYLEEN